MVTIRASGPSFPRSRDPRILDHAPSFVVALLAVALPCAAQGKQITLEELLSAPFPDGLVASPSGGVVAWTFDEGGSRNVWVARPPDYKASESLPIAATTGRRSRISRSRRTAVRSRTCAAEMRTGAARFPILRSTSRVRRRQSGSCRSPAARHAGSAMDTPRPSRHRAIASPS